VSAMESNSVDSVKYAQSLLASQREGASIQLMGVGNNEFSNSLNSVFELGRRELKDDVRNNFYMSLKL
jgi:hypothetical protein